MKRVMIVAGEISGDLFGADLLRELRKLAPDLSVYGVGGPMMVEHGLELLYDSSGWGTIGVVEALKKLPTLYFAYRRLLSLLDSRRPDLLVLVDYPGLNMRLARRAKNRGIPVVYHFPPSKWVMDPALVADAARHIDFVAAPFVSTAKVYRDAGSNVAFVGNPLLDIVKPTVPAAEFRAEFSLARSRTISILPGSRNREIQYLLPLLLESVRGLAAAGVEADFLMPLTSSLFRRNGFDRAFFERAVARSGADVRILVDRTYDALAVSDLAIIASGTATLEAALLGCPMVIIYQVSKVTEFFARRFSALPEHFGLPNLILSRRVVPELLQEEVTPDRMANECRILLDDPERLGRMRSDLKRVARYLGRPGASERVAKRIVSMLESLQI